MELETPKAGRRWFDWLFLLIKIFVYFSGWLSFLVSICGIIILGFCFYAFKAGDGMQSLAGFFIILLCMSVAFFAVPVGIVSSTILRWKYKVGWLFFFMLLFTHLTFASLGTFIYLSL